MAQTVTVLVGKRGADHVDHRGAERQPYFSPSRITVAIATPRSSVRETWEPATPRSASRAFRASENSSTGLPEERLRTQTPCQFAGAWMPVPSALVKASFAAKRLARKFAGRRWP